MKKLIDIKAFITATIVTILTIILVFIGSRSLQNYDAALVPIFRTLLLFLGLFIATQYGYSVSTWIAM